MRVKESPVNDKPTPSPQASARRRLLRGAFSAPAVLTLYSGSAMATKSNERCLINQTKDVAVTPSPSTDADRWFRVQLRKEAGKNVYWVFSNDLPANRSIMTTHSRAQKFGVESSQTSKFNRLYGDETSTLPDASLEYLPKRYAALRVDHTGKVVGIGISGSGGSAIGQSCWNSFKLGA